MNRIVTGGGLLVVSAGVLAGCRSRPTGPVWDVPALVGKSIDAVNGQIGAGQAPVGEGASVDASVKQSIWKREDTTLSATWRPTNKRVTEWTLIARDDAHAVREEERSQLLLVGRLKENDPRYSVDWIESSERPLFYTGVRVTPALKTHAVTLQLSGSAAASSLVQVSYAMTGAQGKTDQTMTVPPWQEAFSLPDDTQITLTASIYKMMAGSASDLTVQIISDGKVVASETSAVGVVKCQAEL